MMKLIVLGFLAGLVAQGSDSADVGRFIEQMRSPDAEISMRGRYELRTMGLLSVHPLLNAWNQERDHASSMGFRLLIVQTLGEIGAEAKDVEGIYEELVEGLLTILNYDSDETVQIRASEELGRQKKRVSTIVANLRRGLRDSQKSFRVRRTCAAVLGRFGADARMAVPDLVTSLKEDVSPEVQDAAAVAVGKIALGLRDAEATDALGVLRDARETVRKEGYPTQELESAIHFLEIVRKSELYTFLIDLLDNHWLLVLLLLWFPTWSLIWVCITLFRPLWLPAINKQWSQSLTIKLSSFEATAIASHLCLLSVFAFRRRVLRQWVRRHAGSLREAALRKWGLDIESSTVVDEPLAINGEAVEGLSDSCLYGLFKSPKVCLFIQGDDRDQRRRVALRIADWVDSLNYSDRMAPVIISDDEVTGDGGLSKDHSALIRERIVSVTGELLDEELLRKLLMKKRILLIVDAPMGNAITFTNPDFPINALVVTSRSDEYLVGYDKTVLTLMNNRRRKNRQTVRMQST
jgi:hypothetical protein